jgi:hypothetical protein
MNLLTKPALAFQVAWTLLALVGGLIVLAITTGTAAWNGVNLAVALYLFLSFAGSIGLLVGTLTAFSKKAIFAWMTGLSAFAITCLTFVFLFGFLFGRLPEVPLGEKIEILGLHAPLLVFYCFSLVTCSIALLLSSLKLRQLNALR